MPSRLTFAACGCTYVRVPPETRPNRVRLDLRCPPDLRDLLVEAAEASYESLTSFVLTAAFDRARTVIRDRKRLEKAGDQLRRMPYTKF